MDNTTNLDNALEAIGQAIDNSEINIEENPEVFNLLDSIKDAYVLVEWPESQDFMEEEWFQEEAILDINSSSNYLVPLKRIL